MESAWAGGERGTLHHGGRYEGKGGRAKHTGRTAPHPTPKLTSGGTCPSRWPSLAVGTPVDSIYLNGRETAVQ